MEKSTEPQPCTQWFVFFKDQLLLKKGYTDKGEIKIQRTRQYRASSDTGSRK